MTHRFRLELEIVDKRAVARARRRSRAGLSTDEAADERAVDAAASYFMRSYQGIRFAIGLVAFGLPWVLIGVDRVLIQDAPQIRGSLSAYYHSSARDVFVGGLVATGGFMLSYMNGKRRTYDYVLSTIAGLLVIVIALVPTGRELDDSRFEVASDSCAKFAGPPACNGVQTKFGEDVVSAAHAVSAGLFVALLFGLCFVFVLREFGYGPAAEDLCGRSRNVRNVWQALRFSRVGLWGYLTKGVDVDDITGHPPRRRTLLYLAMCLLILLAVFWKLFGPDIALSDDFSLKPTYVTEFVAFNAFGIAWMASSKDLGSPGAKAPTPGRTRDGTGTTR